MLLGATSGVLATGGYYVGFSRPLLPYGYALKLAAAAPILASSNADYAWNASAQGAFIGTSEPLREAGLTDRSLVPVEAMANGFSLHQAYYSAYVSYRDARAKGHSPAWNDSWRPCTMSDLLLAPFREKNLSRKIVWIPMTLFTGFTGGRVALNYLSRTPGHPTSESVYARDLVIGAATAWDAAATEEAFFRGFFYEELKLSLGTWPARFIDATAFSLWHVPGELGRETAFFIYEGLLERAVGGVFLEMAYDEGGLPESVAFHALYDLILSVADASVGFQFSTPFAARPADPARGAGGTPFMLSLASGTF